MMSTEAYDGLAGGDDGWVDTTGCKGHCPFRSTFVVVFVLDQDEWTRPALSCCGVGSVPHAWGSA